MDKLNSNSSRRKPLIALTVVGAIVVLFAGLLSIMPKGFSTSHEQIGTGKPAIVFVYDPGLAVSNSQTEQMNEARDQMGDQAYFLIARVGTPEGEQFIAQYRANSAELFVFDSEGNLVSRQYAVAGAGQINQWLQM
ncbi:hypothetical protein [Shewanella maritima]|uniref:hypothetical protein n=1 Tax=Shewanella maritima TaxID=2520507 RepID=UPI003735EB4C